MATVISISSADWGSRALPPGLSDSALARWGKWPEWTQPDDIITGDWTDAAILFAGATAEKGQIAEWFPHTTVFIVLWSPSVYNVLHLFVLHLPPTHLSLPYIEQDIISWNNVEKTKTFWLSLLYYFPTGDSMCDLNIGEWARREKSAVLTSGSRCVWRKCSSQQGFVQNTGAGTQSALSL